MNASQPSSIPDRRVAAGAHLSAVAVALLATVVVGGPTVWAGVAAFAGPLAVRVLFAERAFARAHASAALRFNLSVALYLAVIVAGIRLTEGSAYTIQVIPFLVFMSMLVAFNWLLFTAVAVHRAATGRLFTYPMTLQPPRRLTRPARTA